MNKVEIYTTPICGYCMRAKHLLKQKNIAFEEIDLFSVEGARDEMLKRAQGRRTVPQIFINGEGIGGSDELHGLEATGALDAMLGRT